MGRALLLLWLVTLPSWAGPAACADVNGDRIVGSDMTRALPALHSIPPETYIAPAPLPGGTRIFSETELESLGARFGIRLTGLLPDICFRVPTAPIRREEVLAAMRRAILLPEARIELADVSADPAPPGTIQFPLQGLARPASPDSPSLWQGEVVAGSRHFRIWARAIVTVPLTRLVAVEDLKPGLTIQPDQVRVELMEGFPVAAKTSTPTVVTVTGMTPLRSIPAGSELRLDNLVRPLDVVRGDLVHVEVRIGKARLSFNGRAEGAGRMGQLIAVRNPESNRVFQARVEGKDSVLVDTQGSGAE
jgi:flagella basal body P-ring formation protein FlgA